MAFKLINKQKYILIAASEASSPNIVNIHLYENQQQKSPHTQLEKGRFSKIEVDFKEILQILKPANVIERITMRSTGLNQFEMVLILDNNSIFTIKAELDIQKNTSKGDNSATVSVISFESFTKPTISGSAFCDTTKDFLYCVLRDYSNKKEKNTWLAVWAKRKGVYKGDGYTYRIEELKVKKVEKASTVISYESNQIAYIKSTEGPSPVVIATELQSKLSLRLQNPQEIENLIKQGEELSIRLNDWGLDPEDPQKPSQAFSIELKKFFGKDLYENTVDQKRSWGIFCDAVLFGSVACITIWRILLIEKKKNLNLRARIRLNRLGDSQEIRLIQNTDEERST